MEPVKIYRSSSSHATGKRASGKNQTKFIDKGANGQGQELKKKRRKKLLYSIYNVHINNCLEALNFLETGTELDGSSSAMSWVIIRGSKFALRSCTMNHALDKWIEHCWKYCIPAWAPMNDRWSLCQHFAGTTLKRWGWQTTIQRQYKLMY